jgi:hypothetical protein
VPEAIFLLYSYKSTNADAKSACRRRRVQRRGSSARFYYAVFLLYWYKSANADTDASITLSVSIEV